MNWVKLKNIMNLKNLKLIICLLPLWFFCSIDISDGGGSEVGNGIIAGIVVDSNGDAVQSAKVQIIPDFYDPMVYGSLPDYMTMTTGSNGRFKVELKETGKYNIEVIQSQKQIRALKTNVLVNKDRVYVDKITLNTPGAAYLVLPDTVDTANGYVYILGTNQFEKLSDETIIYDMGKPHVIFDSLPTDTIPAILYREDTPESESMSLFDNVLVTSGDTTIIGEVLGNWQVFNTNNSQIPGDNITSVFVDRDGLLWVGTKASGFATFDGSEWTIYDTSTSRLKNDTIYTIRQDQTGDIWLGVPEAIIRIIGSSWEFMEYPAASYVPKSGFKVITFDNQGHIFFAVDSVFRQRYNDTVYTKIKQSDIPIKDFRSIVSDKENTILVGTDVGLFYLEDPKEANFIRIPIGDLTIANSEVNDIAVDSSNGIWCATMFGVYNYDNSNWINLNNNNVNIPNNNIKCVETDKEGIVWAGLKDHGCIVKCSVVPRVYSGQNVNILNNVGAINDIAVGKGNSVYFATAKGGLVQLKLSYKNN